MKVLIIEDDQRFVQDIRFCLEVRYPDIEIVCVKDGLKGIAMVETESPDLVISDTSLRDFNSLDLVKNIREFSDVPLVFLYEHDSDLDRAKGLEAGVDEYVNKPISPIELLARIKALLRRTQHAGFQPEHVVSIDDSIAINYTTREVFRSGKAIKLTPIEYELLAELARNLNRAVSCETLLEKIWGPECIGDRSFVKKYIYRLRSKLKCDGAKQQLIATERGIGYRLTKHLTAANQ
jgi:two-component system, OmpR family, KDP operon response regulator KdpE